MANPPLTREQVLEELRFLTTVEHAVIVEDLSLHCALGHDLPADDGGATTQQGSAARDQGFALAQVAMFRYKALQLALVEAGGDPELGRATSVSSDSVPETPLVPPDAAQLERFLARAQAIATAVEERYAKLLPAVTSNPVFEDRSWSMYAPLSSRMLPPTPRRWWTCARYCPTVYRPGCSEPLVAKRVTRSSSGCSTRVTGSTTLYSPPFVSSSSTRTSSSQGHFDP
jgi:hypothetical protein